jgi:methyl-accepting chemotaxis protein
MTLNRKLTLLVAVLWAGLLVIACFGAWHSRAQMVSAREETLRELVQEAGSIARHYYDMSQSGAVSEEEAKRQALLVMSKLRFGSDGYVTVSDSRYRNVMHPMKPELANRDMSGFVDAAGNHMFEDIVKAGSQPGGGIFSYMWARPGGDVPVAKTAYSLHFSPWDWFVVTGMYMDDIQRAFYRDLLGWFIITLTLGGAATLIMVLVLRSVRGSLGGELEATLVHARRIAAGNLAGEIALGRDDRHSLLYSLREMQVRLVEMIGQVRAGADNVNVGATEIAAGNADLSQRTEEQASALIETTSSMEHMTANVRKNAESAQHAARLAVDAANVAARGRDVVGDVVRTMGEISSRSGQIADILGVIDGIAFQTNILALNAAVEAARAGEQGRGFAVVASEVRSLAQRSASAAKEIKALIDASSTAVEAGTSLVDNAGATMDEILEAAKNVASILDEISVASNEQRTGIEEVDRAVGEMDQVTQQNAALVEQAAAAAASLRDQANAMRQTISIFTLPAEASEPVLPRRIHDTASPAARLDAPSGPDVPLRGRA